MKKFNFKRSAAMAMAVMMSVSAISVSAFAAEDEIFATVEDNNGNITYIYNSDLVNGEYTMTAGDEVVTFSERANTDVMPLILNGTFSRTSAPTSWLLLNENLILTYNLPASTSARYSPTKYYTVSGKIDFAFDVTEGGDRKVTGHVKTNNNLYTMNLTGTTTHAVTVSGCSSTGSAAYAYVQNPTANTATAVGQCLIRPM